PTMDELKLDIATARERLSSLRFDQTEEDEWLFEPTSMRTRIYDLRDRLEALKEKIPEPPEGSDESTAQPERKIV
ncbi:MAG: hypothetical protein AAF492_03620, partial [Verrucomicrobiota bacterium]